MFFHRFRFYSSACYHFDLIETLTQKPPLQKDVKSLLIKVVAADIAGVVVVVVVVVVEEIGVDIEIVDTVIGT